MNLCKAKRTVQVTVTVLLLATAHIGQADVVPIQAMDECPVSGGECHEINGVITEKDLAVVRAIAERATKGRKAPLKTLFFRLNSKGGDVDAAIQIGWHLRKLSAIAGVFATSECLSSCVFVLAGATQRVISSSAKIGIHRPYSLRTDLRDYAAVQQEHTRLSVTVKTFLEEMNLPTSLYDAMMRIPPENIRVLTHKELATFGLDQTDPVEQELHDAYDARKYGLNKLEYIRRKGEVANVCALAWSAGQSSRNFDEYFSCKERIMRRGSM